MVMPVHELFKVHTRSQGLRLRYHPDKTGMYKTQDFLNFGNNTHRLIP